MEETRILIKNGSDKGGQFSTKLAKKKRRRKRGKKNAKEVAPNKPATLPSESAPLLDNKYPPALQYPSNPSDLPTGGDVESGKKADASTPGDVILYSKEGLDDQELSAGIGKNIASDVSAFKASILRSEEEPFDPDLTTKPETKSVPADSAAEEWLSYPDTRLDDRQAHLFAMQQPVGATIFSEPLLLEHKEPSAEAPQSRQIRDSRPPTNQKLQ